MCIESGQSPTVFLVVVYSIMRLFSVLLSVLAAAGIAQAVVGPGYVTGSTNGELLFFA
jgi:hypothetical protein